MLGWGAVVLWFGKYVGDLLCAIWVVHGFFVLRLSDRWALPREPPPGGNKDMDLDQSLRRIPAGSEIVGMKEGGK